MFEASQLVDGFNADIAPSMVEMHAAVRYAGKGFSGDRPLAEFSPHSVSSAACKDHAAVLEISCQEGRVLILISSPLPKSTESMQAVVDGALLSMSRS
jgi:hypothetical protein